MLRNLYDNPPEPDTLRRIAEDCLLLAHNAYYGGDLGEDLDGDEAPDEIDAKRAWRSLELTISIAERICRAAGISDPWVPTTLQDIVETPAVES